MSEKEKKPLDPTGFEVTELEDEDLEGVAGGAADNQCPIENYNCVPGCGGENQS